MKCYTHPQVDAVGQCPECGRGICHNCSREVGGLCPSCFRTGLLAEQAEAHRRLTRTWVMTALVAIVGTIAAISSDGAVGILLIPVAFAGGWCFAWGWPSVWGWFRRHWFAVWGSWLFIVIVVCLFIEVLIFVALGIGLFTGIKRYREAKWVIANSNRLLAGLADIPVQPMAGGTAKQQKTPDGKQAGRLVLFGCFALRSQERTTILASA